MMLESTHEITKQSLVWKPGKAEWAALETVPECVLSFFRAAHNARKGG